MKLPIMFQWPIRRHFCCDWEPDWTFTLQRPMYRRPAYRGSPIPPESLATIINEFRLLNDVPGAPTVIRTQDGRISDKVMVNDYTRLVAWPLNQIAEGDLEMESTDSAEWLHTWGPS